MTSRAVAAISTRSTRPSSGAPPMRSATHTGRLNAKAAHRSMRSRAPCWHRPSSPRPMAPTPNARIKTSSACSTRTRSIARPTPRASPPLRARSPPALTKRRSPSISRPRRRRGTISPRRSRRACSCRTRRMLRSPASITPWSAWPRDAAGLALWENDLAKGDPLTNIATDLIGSTEYAARFGSPDTTQFVGHAL